MLILLVTALLATFAFYKRSRQLGARTGKLASVPFVTAGVFLVVGHIASWLVTFVCNEAKVLEGTTKIIIFCMNCFGLLAYFLVIRNYWLAMNAEAAARKPAEANNDHQENGSSP